MTLPEIGTPARFARLRAELIAAGYDEAAVCAATGIESVFEFKTIFEERVERFAKRKRDEAVRSRIDLLVRLLMDGEPIEESEVVRWIGPSLLEALEDLRVVARQPGKPEICYSTSFLYPVAGLLAASDRTFLSVPLPGEQLPEDVVYAAITENTKRFLSILPDSRCGDFLDLCSGTGIAALVAARHARHAWATDLGKRCVHYSEFNRLLNGIENLTAAQGDLFGAVGDRTFDRISAHPPYVPSRDNKLMFRDGGDDGEQILRRIIEGLPAHLNPGGRFYCVTMATDRETDSFEQRIRKWLGAHEAEFDVFLIASEIRKRPEEFIRAVSNAQNRLTKLGERARMLEELQVTALYYGTVVIQRVTSPRPVATARRQKAATAANIAVEWLCGFERDAAQQGFQEHLLGAKLHHGPGLRLDVTHESRGGQLVPTRFRLRVSYPMASDAFVDPWVAMLAGSCDGTSELGRIREELIRQDQLDSGMSVEEFCNVVRVLVSSGFLEWDRYPLPREARS